MKALKQECTLQVPGTIQRPWGWEWSAGGGGSGAFGQSRGWALEGVVVNSVASALGEMGASGGAEDRSHLVWLLLFFCFCLLFSIIRIAC